MKTQKLYLAVFMIFGALAIVSCSDDSVEDKTENAMERVEDTTEDAQEQVEDKSEELGDKAEDKAEDVTD